MRKVEVFESERARGYDQFVDTWIPNYHYFLDLLPKLLGNVQTKELLVVGCGTGNEIARFATRGDQWHITGIDPSPEMIQQAIEKLQSYPNVSLVQTLVNNLDVDKKYHAATLLLVLHFIEDDGSKLDLLRDIAKRLASGAPLILLDITGNKSQIQENLQLLKLLLPEGIPDDQIEYRLQRIEKELFHVSEERLIALCLEAGFSKPFHFFQSTIYMGWITNKL